jgi:hypothetical protein
VQHLDDFGVIEPALADQLGQPVDDRRRVIFDRRGDLRSDR